METIDVDHVPSGLLTGTLSSYLEASLSLRTARTVKRLAHFDAVDVVGIVWIEATQIVGLVSRLGLLSHGVVPTLKMLRRPLRVPLAAGTGT
jgi:hypothetical protein